MKLAALSQKEDKRTPLVPELVAKFQQLGFVVAAQSGIGMAAGFSDDAYTAAGVKLQSDGELLADADVVLTTRAPEAGQITQMKKGAVVAGMLDPFGDQAFWQNYADAGLSAFALESMPRITRAQSMDVLSSQSNLAGYKAVIDGVGLFGKAIPMMMTAAGTIAPARVFVMGVGVAGLQAIATAKRLGAIVSATDVRPAVKEQVESLGGSFVMVEDEETKEAQTAGGYAKEMSADYQRRQQALIEETIKTQDIVICTALIPGRPAPKLVSASMVRAMKPGAVIVDIAASQGGNCELTKRDEVVEEGFVKIAGWSNLAAALAKDSSTFYARNLLNFITLMVVKGEEKGAAAPAVQINWEDEIFTQTALVKNGAVQGRG